MPKIDIAGLKIDTLTKQELLNVIHSRITAGQKTWITTPYSEFLYAGLRDKTVMDMLNRADIAVADGIGLFWAKRFLEIPLTAKSYWGKIIQALWQVKYSLAAIIFYPSWIKSALPEKIAGADLIWDLAKLAANNNFSIYLLGGFGDTPKIVAEKIIKGAENLGREKEPPYNFVVQWSNKNPDDPTIIVDIKNAAPDMLFVAFGPIKQEQWIAANINNLPIKLAIGLGGTFDYIAGKVPNPPKFVRNTGLEWLYRLFTQPHRVLRIFNATFGLISELILYKLFQPMAYRKNVVSVIINDNKKIFIAQRNPSNKQSYIVKREMPKYLNYWQLPQGGVKVHEDISQAAMREVEEETGIKNLKLLKISDSTNQYDFTYSWARLFDTDYRYKGQKQNIAYFKFLGDENEIKIDKNELINYKWVPLGELHTAVHEERAALAQIVQEDLKEMGEKGII